MLHSRRRVSDAASRRARHVLLAGTALAQILIGMPARAQDAAGAAQASGQNHPAKHPGAAQHRAAARVEDEKFDVVGRRASGTGTIAQARTVQKNAPNIVNVLPQSEIEKLPNANIGEALRRLPGVSTTNAGGEPRYFEIRGLGPTLSGVTFDGVQLVSGTTGTGGRAVPVDDLPAGVFGGIELIKTGRPDAPADALGGQVNLLFRDVPADGKPFLDVHMASGFYQPHMTNAYDGTISAGMRFGLHSNPFDKHGDNDKPFSIVAWATGMSDWRYLDDTQSKFKDGTSPRNAVSQIAADIYANHRVHWGYGGALGWDVNPGTHLYFKASDGGYDTSGLRYQQIYSITSTYAGAAGGAYSGTATEQQGTRDLFQRVENRVFKFGGTTQLHLGKLDYWGAYNSNFVYTPYQFGSTFSGSKSFPVIVHDANAQLPTVQVTNGYNPTDYSAFALSGLNGYHQNDMDSAWDGHIGWTVPLNLGPVRGSFETGGGVRLRSEVNNDITTTYSKYPALTAAQLAGDKDFTTFGGLYDLGKVVGNEAIRQLIDDHGNLLTRNVTADRKTNAAAYLSDNENIYNGYAQYNAQWGRVGMLAGVRIEKTDGIYRANTLTTNTDGTLSVSPNHVGQEYTNFFPTVQLRYNFTPDLIARATWSTAIARPGFNQITAATSLNIASNTISTGNPNLKPTTGNSFDVDLEYYMPHGGIVSGGVFDKEFKNYIVSSTTYGGYPGFAGIFTYTTYGNINYGYARGVELNYRQTFDFAFMPKLLRGLGVGGNWTYVKTGGLGRAGAEEPLPYTTPHVFNFEVFYNHGPLDVQFDGNYTGLQLQSLGTTPSLDTFQQPTMTYDLGATYKLTKNASFSLQIRNLTAEPVVNTEGAENWRVSEIQSFGREFLFGLDVHL